MRPVQKTNGESNNSLSTKPTTSTTLNSNRKKEQGEKGKDSKPAKNAKQKPHIYFVDDLRHKNHKVNKAVNTINNIIRLIFKNSKDSVALTSSMGQSSLSGSNRLIDEAKIQEISKIAKQVQINIPKKFDSKSALREYFFSREFILNMKIKMNNMLHKAIL